MWRFNETDECRYDYLTGMTLEMAPRHRRRPSPGRRRYLLSVAARYCRWRDGLDPRRSRLSNQDADRVELGLMRDLVPLGSDETDRLPNRQDAVEN